MNVKILDVLLVEVVLLDILNLALLELRVINILLVLVIMVILVINLLLVLNVVQLRVGNVLIRMMAGDVNVLGDPQEHIIVVKEYKILLVEFVIQRPVLVLVMYVEAIVMVVEGQ